MEILSGPARGHEVNPNRRAIRARLQMLASSFSRRSLSILHAARPRHLVAPRRAAFLSVFGTPTRSIKRGIWQAARVTVKSV